MPASSVIILIPPASVRVVYPPGIESYGKHLAAFRTDAGLFAIQDAPHRWRTALKKHFAAIFSAILCVATFSSGCSRISPSMENSSPGGAGPNPWTVSGVLRIGARLVPDNLNPVVGTQGIDTDLAMLWASYLLTLDDKSRLVPDLAAVVPSLSNGGISRDGLTITYQLRHGVKWQDGAPFTAADVAFTWQAVMNKKNFVPSRAGYELISRIDTPGRMTGTVSLSASTAIRVARSIAASSSASSGWRRISAGKNTRTVKKVTAKKG